MGKDPYLPHYVSMELFCDYMIKNDVYMNV
jgi:hypothetical protein